MILWRRAVRGNPKKLPFTFSRTFPPGIFHVEMLQNILSEFTEPDNPPPWFSVLNDTLHKCADLSFWDILWSSTVVIRFSLQPLSSSTSDLVVNVSTVSKH